MVIRIAGKKSKERGGGYRRVKVIKKQRKKYPWCNGIREGGKHRWGGTRGGFAFTSGHGKTGKKSREGVKCRAALREKAIAESIGGGRNWVGVEGEKMDTSRVV